ncbi:MAG: hypothetical protein JXQ85_06790 [Cognatishimia sp.]|uniref:hypothetical protein n=1 Tax=Cognatishimia sp. TaxID=2211648 RepID=UPI003B8BA040
MFNKPEDLRYVRFLRNIQQANLFDWYMEIGCRTGRTFEPVRGKTIAVDPFFKITTNVIGQKPALMCFQQTSDAFFESNVLDALNVKLSFSFLDGMHLMEFLLRDFINAERNSHAGGVIAMHDCCPFDHEMTTRNVDDAPASAWTGDVWKLIPILQKYRPDLDINVVGCRPTGLVLVNNLSPDSRVLSDHYDEILTDWQELPLQEYGADTFYNSFEYTPAKEIAADNYAFFKNARMKDAEHKLPEFVSP